MDAVARGCRRAKSPLTNAAEPFISGEFQLFQKGERYAIEQCQVREGFYELRLSLIHIWCPRYAWSASTPGARARGAS